MAADRKLLLERFVADAREAVGEGLRAVFLYGKAALTHDSPSSVQLTTALVVDSVGTGVLKRVAALAKSWKRRGLPAPLLLDTEQLCTSCDVFPLELLAMQDAHLMLWGEPDPLAALVVDREHLRLEVEEQLKGKLLHLRQVYLDVAGNPKELRALLLDSSAGFEMILRGLLHVAGRERPQDSETLVRSVEEVAAVDMTTFRRVRAAARASANGADLGDAEAAFEHYHDELAALTRAADRFTFA